MASPDLTQAETSDTVQPPTQDEAGKQDEVVDEMNDEERELKEAAEEEAREKVRREREARAQALTLEIVGDLPYAEVKPPENVLFVCKLNPVTEGQIITPVHLTLIKLTANHSRRGSGHHLQPFRFYSIM